jgi:hypothetical protein
LPVITGFTHACALAGYSLRISALWRGPCLRSWQIYEPLLLF